MIKYREHRPAFIDTDRVLASGEVATLDDMLELDFIKGYHRYQVSIHPLQSQLMMVTENGEVWVVATIEGNVAPTEKIPAWDGSQRATECEITDVGVDVIAGPVIPLDDLLANGTIKITARGQ